ncbi:TcpQ domain-containing protein (plasmid) [Pantoea allii]|uniref:TcpQ domain-containing protein n=1 Tax=Pantoea allii TaxID=574096 RepID=UPI0039779E0C
MSFTERAGLLTALLLTGCASPAVISGPPSGNVVDGLLTRSAADISAMQYRVYQSGPTAKRPISASAVTSLMPLPSHSVPVTSKVRSHQTMPTEPFGLSAGPSDNFIRQGGAAPTLRAALRKIVPPGQNVVFTAEVKPDAPELWQWYGNDRWPYVANRMLSGKGLRATINNATHTVTIGPEQKGQSVKTASPLPVLNRSVPVMPDIRAKTVTGRDPFSDDRLAAKNSGRVVRETPVVPAYVPPPVPVIPVKHWRIEKGTTLRDGFTLWASAEQCSPQKQWQVRWDANANYPIDYPLSFSATSFEEATRQLFALWKTAKIPLFVDGYGAPQCLIVVHDSHGM